MLASFSILAAGVAFALRPGINNPAICAPGAAPKSCVSGPTGCNPALACSLLRDLPDDAGNQWLCGCQTGVATLPWYFA